LGTVPAAETRTVTLELHVPSAAATGTAVTLDGAFAHRVAGRSRTATASATAEVRPVVAAEPVHAALPLAAGSRNRADLRLVNHAARPLTVSLAATAPPGVDASFETATVELAAGELRTVTVALANEGLASGTSELAVTATTASGARAEAVVTLHHWDDLARNGLGAPWPAASASGSQDAYPPALATDGSASTFWVSDGTARGEGPTPERPKLLAVDLGAPLTVGRVTMVPRPGYGPRAYTIELSEDGQAWQQVAAVPAAPNAAVTTPFAPATARHVRLRITDSHDAQRPPRNVQVVALEVRPR
jgi:hypothetical protein